MTTNWMGWMMSGIVLLLLFAVGAILKNPVFLLLAGERSRGVVVGLHAFSRDSLASPAPGDNLLAPAVEFVTSAGERVTVSGRGYTASPTDRVGDKVSVAYRLSKPRDAQILTWSDFPIVPVAMLLGFIAVILMLWVSFILFSGEPANGDPFHLLPTLIAHFRLDPFRFPMLFILSMVIPACGIGTYAMARRSLDLRANGIHVVGTVRGAEWSTTRSNSGSRSLMNASFPTIAYKDTSGVEHTVLGHTAYPYSRLKPGDTVGIIYLARTPADGEVNAWFDMYFVAVFFGSMMVAFIILFRLVLIRATGYTG